MSNSFYNYQKVENGQNISSIPIRNFISNKCISKKYKNRIMPINNKIQENKDKNHSQIILNSENIISNDNTKYIHCKRHPKNIISFYCEDDRTFPCILCISKHEEHSYKKCYFTKNYFNKEMLKMKKSFEDIEIKYFQNKKNAENFFSKIKIHFDKEMHKINEFFDSMISILQDKKNEYIAKMLIIYENYLKKFIKYKFVFDSCDKTYYTLNKKMNYIENEIYKKEDLESFYNIKHIFINEINDFSKCNDENFDKQNIFYFNSSSMPIFVYPEKPIINIKGNINSFGSFKNANIDFNQKENENEQNKIKEKIALIDSINIDNTLQNNNSNIKRNKTNLEILLESSKNKNIISSINTQLSNINDTLIEKQLIDTNSTLFFLNKNEVKNVFNQQDEDTNQIFERHSPKINNNEEIKISDSPKKMVDYENNYKKVKYTSCNKENRNKQIIKKFLEKEELIRNNISRLTTNQSNLNREKNTNNHSNYFASFDNNYRNHTLNNDYEIKKINIDSKNKKKNKKYPPNNWIKYRQMAYKKSNSITKNINSFNIELKNNKYKNKKKKIPNKEKINNINKYINNPFEREFLLNENNNGSYYQERVNGINNGIEKNYKYKKNNLVKNHRNVKSMKNLRKNRLNYDLNNILNNMPKPDSQFCRITDNNSRRNSLSNYNINRSNSYRYYKKDIFFQ